MRRPNFEAIEQLDRTLARERPVDYELNRKQFDALYRLAVHHGVWRTGDPLRGLDADIRYARAINGRRASG